MILPINILTDIIKFCIFITYGIWLDLYGILIKIEISIEIEIKIALLSFVLNLEYCNLNIQIKKVSAFIYLFSF